LKDFEGPRKKKNPFIICKIHKINPKEELIIKMISYKLSLLALLATQTLALEFHTIHSTSVKDKNKNQKEAGKMTRNSNNVRYPFALKCCVPVTRQMQIHSNLHRH
jgi:hypothetical protein